MTLYLGFKDTIKIIFIYRQFGYDMKFVPPRNTVTLGDTDFLVESLDQSAIISMPTYAFHF